MLQPLPPLARKSDNIGSKTMSIVSRATASSLDVFVSTKGYLAAVSSSRSLAESDATVLLSTSGVYRPSTTSAVIGYGGGGSAFGGGSGAGIWGVARSYAHETSPGNPAISAIDRGRFDER
jgi:acetyl-CoA carboxylase alpha subunit